MSVAQRKILLSTICRRAAVLAPIFGKPEEEVAQKLKEAHEDLEITVIDDIPPPKTAISQVLDFTAARNDGRIEPTLKS